MNNQASDWNHFKVFVALVSKGMRLKNLCLEPPYYVEIYPQATNAALLYDLDRPEATLHIHEKRVDQKLWSELKPYVRKSGGTDAKGFDYYEVIEWNEFAALLGLKCP